MCSPRPPTPVYTPPPKEEKEEKKAGEKKGGDVKKADAKPLKEEKKAEALVQLKNDP